MADIFALAAATPSAIRAREALAEREAAFAAAGLKFTSATAERETAKRWGKLNGYEGATGGFIYRKLPDGSWKPVCQGWRSFFDKKRDLILADVQAGKFKPSRSGKA